MEILLQIALVIFLVFLNGFFVASEFALVAVRKTRIDELVQKGNKAARLVQKSIENLDTYISATQLGITLASLALGWIGEPFIAHILEDVFNNFLPENLAFISAHSLSFLIAFSTITFLHIVLGELVPKTIALQKSEATSLLIIAPLSLFATIFKPFIWALNTCGGVVLKIVGFKAASGHQLVHSEDEIKMLLAQSAQEGAIDKEEAEMVYSVFKLGDTPVKSVMIPKNRIVAFEKNTSLSKVIKTTQKYSHSRFPIYDKSIENIIGFIHIKDIYMSIVSEKKLNHFKDFYKILLSSRKSEKDISDLNIIRKIPYVKDNYEIDKVLILLRNKMIHMAVVKNKNGKTSGVVTLEDIVERLVGKIGDEFDEVEINYKKKNK